MFTRLTQEQKLHVVESALEIGPKEAAKIAGVHFATVYQWKKELEALGREGFLHKKTTYPGRGVKKITEQQERHVLDTWQNNPEYGPGQVRNQLRRQAITISIRTIRSIMEANGYKVHKKKNNKEECQRFEAKRPYVPWNSHKWTSLSSLSINSRYI